MIKIKTDYHTHTTHSWDGRSTPVAMCERAVALGLDAIAFTEHAEWFPDPKGFENPDAYFADIAACNRKFDLNVLSGVELGNPHRHASDARALIEAYPFDIHIGSVHWLYNENIHNKRVFSRRDPNQVLRDYFAELADMVNNFPLDIVAHFDRIFMRAHYSRFAYDLRTAEGAIRAALAAVVTNAVTLEFSSKYINDKTNWNDDLLTILRWYREAGGERIMVNSDSHDAGQIGRNFQTAADMLMQLGFTHTTDMSPARTSTVA